MTCGRQSLIESFAALEFPRTTASPPMFPLVRFHSRIHRRPIGQTSRMLSLCVNVVSCSCKYLMFSLIIFYLLWLLLLFGCLLAKRAVKSFSTSNQSLILVTVCCVCVSCSLFLVNRNKNCRKLKRKLFRLLAVSTFVEWWMVHSTCAVNLPAERMKRATPNGWTVCANWRPTKMSHLQVGHRQQRQKSEWY